MRIQSIDVEGGAELADALTELGVRLVKRGGDLTVTLVNDYLETSLADLNAQHLADQSPWLLVQPSGLFPLVGPVFSPGKGACWTCLSDRMKRNREIKALLDRREARCLVASPLAHHSVGQSGIQLAAIEIAKAIATEFRTELNDHMLSLDLLGSTIVKHYVPARPQCPSCGQKKLRDPRRPPVPFEIGAGGKVVMTSGGYRSVSSAATVARFRRHVSPLTGVVSRLERIQADLPLNTNFRATHNFSGPSETFHELRSGLMAGSFGKGSTAEQGEASALMEAIERYSGIFQGDEIRRTRRFADFASGEAIPPNDMLLFSDAQLRQAQNPEGGMQDSRRRPLCSIPPPRSNGRRSGRCAMHSSDIFRPAFCISSIAVQSHSPRIRTAAPPATRARKQSSKVSWNSWNAMPMRSGGTTGCRGRKWTSANSTTAISAI